MEVNIGEIESTVRTYDADAPLSPRTMAAIVQAVVEALEAREEHESRVAAETQVNTGIVQ
jgi:hypothetical protein